MLRPLLLLFAVIAVPGVAGQYFTTSQQFDISSCPITYYGQKYEEVYVNFTSKKFVVCFDGFYSPQTGGDCLLALPANEAQFLQTDSPKECFIRFTPNNKVTIVVSNIGSQSSLRFQCLSPGTAVLDVLINGNKVNELSVTNPKPNSLTFSFLDISGCRHGGVVYKPGTTTVLPKFCETVDCSSKAVLKVTSTCGPMQTCLGNNKCVTTTTATPTTSRTTATPTTTEPHTTNTIAPHTTTTTAHHTTDTFAPHTTTTTTPRTTTTTAPRTTTTTAPHTTTTTTAPHTTTTTTAPHTTTTTTEPHTTTTTTPRTTTTALPPTTTTTTARTTTTTEPHTTTTTTPRTTTTTATPRTTTNIIFK